MGKATPATAATVKRFMSMLRRLEKDAKLSKSDLATITHQNLRTVRSWFKGRKPGVESIDAVEDALRAEQKSLDELLRAVNTALGQ